MLVDTNVIIEAHRSRTWTALTSAYSVQSVEDCVTETQTGFQHRLNEQIIDLDTLRATLDRIHKVQDFERASLALLAPSNGLDLGERSLWAHALGRSGNWRMCSPDIACIRCVMQLQFRDRQVSLEELLEGIGHRVRLPLRRHYTKSWLTQTCTEILLAQ